MPVPRELPQQIPPPPAKDWMQRPQGGANFWCKCTGVREGGGMVMDKTDTCIILLIELLDFSHVLCLDIR